MKNDQYSVDETRAKDMMSKQMKYSEIFKYGRAKGWTVKCPGIYDWMPGDTKQRWEENKSISSKFGWTADNICLLYTSPSPRDRTRSRMPSSA